MSDEGVCKTGSVKYMYIHDLFLFFICATIHTLIEVELSPVSGIFWTFSQLLSSFYASLC